MARKGSGKGARAGYQKRQAYSMQDILTMNVMPSDRQKLLQIYKTAAKAADQRLVRLERYGEEKNFKTAVKWSYARAQRDIQAWSGPDATRFNTKPPESIAELKAKIEDIKTFLKSPTSTKSGIKSIYEQRAKSFNKNHPGANYTWEDFGKLFESDLAKKLDEDYGSETKAKTLVAIQKNGKKIDKALKEAKEKDIRVPDKMVSRTVKRVLKEYPGEVQQLLLDFGVE